MDEQQPTSNAVKGKVVAKELPGAINVLPAGLGEVLKKRESREFKMEEKSGSMSFSTGTRGGGEVSQTFSSMKSAKESSSSFSSSISAPAPMQQQQQHLASAMSSSASMQQQKTTSTSFSSSMSSASSQQQQSFVQQGSQAITQQKKVLQPQPQQVAAPVASIKHGEEIKQEDLKTTIQSAITDLEQDIDKTVVDSGDKENYAPPSIQQQVIPEFVEAPPPSMTMPQNGHSFEEYKHGTSEFDRKLKIPREFSGRPESQQGMEEYIPSEKNLIGVPDFSELDGSGKMTEQFSSSSQQSKEQTLSIQSTTTSTFNGHVQQESQQQQNFLSSSAVTNNPVLEKALAPATDADYDSNSLKRRNPRQMFTDSSFYSPKFHPSVADQVEMAHALSTSLYTDGNKMSKGQEMYLKRAKTSGDTSDIEASLQQPGDKPLNLKLVMNPEGKLHDWTDLPEEEIPELQQIATGGHNPEAQRQMVENLQACKGKGGELFAKRRKKADKWVVDEGSARSNPSQLADQFLVQENSFQQQEYHQERTEISHHTEVDSGGAEERQRQQEEFHQQQLLKQQQGFEMRQERQSNAALPGGPAAEELPPNFQHCSLKGRPFTPTMDLSIHNTQGIDVWTTKGPKPFGLKSGTLPRTTIKQATMSGELPPQPSKPQPQQQQAPPPAALAVPQVAICPATPAVNESELIVSSQQQASSTSMSSSSSVTTVQQGGVNSVDLEEQKRREYEQWFKTQEREQQALEYDCSVKCEATTYSTNVSEAHSVQQSSVQEVATHTQIAQKTDEVDHFCSGAKQAADLQRQQKLEQEQREKEMREEQQRLEQMKREQELKEQQLREQQQREQQMLEQQQKLREQEALEMQRKEQELREKQLLEQQAREQEAREQQLREQQLREEQMREQQMQEQQMREQQMREQQMQEQQMREQQMREQQMQEQQMREQQLREQQMREQQMREQQMREQQMREQQIKEQQMREQQIQQQQFEQQQMSMSRTTTETSSFSQQQSTQSLHQSGLTMQVKSGGVLSGSQNQQVEDYTSSLKPTSEGELIRTQGDLQYTQSSVEQSNMERVQLRKTGGSKDINDTIRQSGVFVGIAGEHNALINEMFDNEKHSVKDIVKHFSKVKPGDIPQQMMPQHYQMQHAPPSLTELQDQAKERQFSYQKRDQVDSSAELSMSEQKAAQEKMKTFERRTSLKDFMLMEGEKTQQINIIDPSNILQVDGSVEGKKLYNGTRRTASGRALDSEGRLIDTDKWDNHNAIARGWKTVEDNYHPVTFRKLYGVEKQAPTPVPMMRQATPVTANTPVQQTLTSEQLEGASDL